ncbi:MAG: TatD family hydrolase [Rikenellaceae bacterium]|nr:TatD family hydrolase [Rikenellaceae bacterium]
MNLPYIDIHTHNLQKEEDTLKIFSVLLNSDTIFPENILFSAGIHPWNANTAKEKDLNLLYSQNNNLVAVGETGLDFAINNSDKDKQVYWLKKQLEIASELKLPVVIHCVKAYYKILEILDNYPLKSIIFHSFIGSKETASEIIKRGYLISVSDRSLRSPKTIDVLKSINLDSVLLESDESGNIKDNYMKLSNIKNIYLSDLKKNIFENYLRIFNA